VRRLEMKRHPTSLRSVPPEGALSPFGTAGRYESLPPTSLRSVPPKGALSPFGTAGRY
jgi:hypothetical protein